VYSSSELADVGSVREGRVFSRARLVFFSGTDRLRANGWSVVQSAVAASVAYLLAIFVLGHERPFFAAIAAVICLGVTLGQRARDAVEVVFGVAFGLMVADLLVLPRRPGPLDGGGSPQEHRYGPGLRPAGVGRGGRSHLRDRLRGD
jgi:hypothetical protein